jgi:hypothetical protein
MLPFVPPGEVGTALSSTYVYDVDISHEPITIPVVRMHGCMAALGILHHKANAFCMTLQLTKSHSNFLHYRGVDYRLVLYCTG